MVANHSQPEVSSGRQQLKAHAALHLQQQAAASQQPPARSHYRPNGWLDWQNEPVWNWPIPEPPDWDQLSPEAQHTYKVAAVAYALAEVARQRGKSSVRQIIDWGCF